MLLSDFNSDTEVIEAKGADQAIDLCSAEGPFDLVLLDLMLDGVNGLVVLDELGERLPGVPVVIVSASESRVDIRAAFQRGAKGYIVKSSTAEAFKLALRLVLLGEIYVRRMPWNPGGIFRSTRWTMASRRPRAAPDARA